MHWGTFSLAVHAWDDPVETLLRLGSKSSVPLVMPRLGEPVEPSRAGDAKPWWRAVDAIEPEPRTGEVPAMTLPKTMPWPFD